MHTTTLRSIAKQSSRHVCGKYSQKFSKTKRVRNDSRTLFIVFSFVFLTWFSFVSLLKFFLGRFFSFVPKLRFLLLLNCEKHFSQLVFWAFVIFLSSFYCKKQLFTTCLLCFGWFSFVPYREKLLFTPFLLCRCNFSFVSLV